MTAFQRRLLPDRQPAAQRARQMRDPGFGRVFSEHMVTARYDAGQGWHDAAVVPFGPVELSPASAVLHYAQAVFEGLKAYEQPDGSVAAFRPQANAERLRASAARLAIPELPEGFFLESIRELVAADRDWVPAHGGQESLYLRPLVFADDPSLAVRPSHGYRFLLIASVAGDYFAGGLAPVTVWLSTELSRAAPGGTGAVKCAGNYAGSLLAQAEAQARGCDQVVWLDPVEHCWVEEMGGMNLFFVEREGGRTRLVTPALTGTLLPGVTRDAILCLARELGAQAQERAVSVAEWESGCRAGRIVESFACGTAAVVTPVGAVRHADGGWRVGDGGPGPLTLAVRQRLLDIQRGLAADPHGWMVPVG